MHLIRITAFVAFALVALCAPAADPAPSPGESRPLRILFIGNSLTYTNGLPLKVRSLAGYAGETRDVETAEATLPNVGLSAHWDGRALDLLRGSRWDYVVLQEAFFRPLSSPDRFRESVRLFDGEIRKAGAKTILFLHWSRPRDPEAQAKMNDLYLQTARELDALVAPVGPAWQIALRNSPGISLYNSDGMHPTPMGTYLAGCVFYSLIFGKPVPAADPDEGNESIARKAAWEAVQAMKAP